MADNVELDAGTGGSTIATDDDGTAHHQYTKVEYGPDNTQTKVTATNGLPIQGDGTALPVDGSSVTQPVSAAALPLPSGAATSAAQLADGHNVANAGTFAVQADSVIPGVGATNLGKAEDAAHSSGDTGVMALGVRNDTLAAFVGTDGDYTPLQMDAEGRVYVAISNNDLVSTNNSSTDVLAGDVTFTGTGEDISDYAAVSVQVFASHVSATDGLSVEFSTDNSNWDEKHTASVMATTSREFVFPTHAQYFRIVYTNGSTLQTAFRLQVILHVQSVSSTAHSLEESNAADDVAILTKSVVIAQAAGTGDFVPVQATTAGNLKVSIEEADTSASGLAKAEDAVHSSGDVGVMALGVRTDSPASTAADGDYVPFLMSEEGGVWTEHLPSEIDAGNSSTSTLLADAVFTGTGISLLDHQAVAVIIDASHDSAIDGMQFQFSSDNSNWDVSLDFTYTAVNGGRIFQFGVYAQYFRVVYTNGGTGQTHFRLQTLLHHDTTLTTIHRLTDDASPDRSAEVVKSVIFAQTSGAGDFKAVAANSQGKLQVAADIDGAAIESIEDDQHTTGDVGIMPLAVRNDTLASLVDADGDYAPVQVNALGAVYVQEGAPLDVSAATVTVDGSGVTQPVSAAALPLPSGAATSANQLADGHNVTVQAGTDLIGDVGISGARTAGGTTPYKNIDVDESEDQIKGTAGQVYWVHAINQSSAVLYLKFYDDTAANVIVGTTVPDLTFPIPTQGDSNGAGFTLSIPNGIAFGTAITVAATTGIADNDSGAPGANTVILNLGYA